MIGTLLVLSSVLGAEVIIVEKGPSVAKPMTFKISLTMAKKKKKVSQRAFITDVICHLISCQI